MNQRGVAAIESVASTCRQVNITNHELINLHAAA